MTDLVLFDIDGTLLKSGGLGLVAMERAARELLHPDFHMHGIEVAGRLDALIVRDMFVRAGVVQTSEATLAFRRRFASIFRQLVTDSSACRALPGGPELVAAVRRTDGFVAGLLTGNYQETGTLKLELAGYEPPPAGFAICAWGDDSPHDPPDRAHLTAVAMERFRMRFAARPDPRRVTIIGDTPHDVRCAHAHGCRCIAVATGQYSRKDLHAAGADLVVDDLNRTDELMSWMTDHRRASLRDPALGA